MSEQTAKMDIREVEVRDLFSEAALIRHDNWRLIQICATKTADDLYEILYTFGRGYEWKNLRITVHGDDKIPSITKIYEIAYLYENEIHDLYGIEIDLMNYDFQGRLFRTGVQYPFR